MPKLGMAMKAGLVTNWRVQEGEPVTEGAALLDIETEKIAAVVPAPATGVLGRVVAEVGAKLPVGALLALIGDPADVFPPKGELVTTAAPAAAEAAPPRDAPISAAAQPRDAPVSPAARRRAREIGVDVNLVAPSAPGKRVTSDDVDAYAAARAAGAAATTRVVPFTGIRAVIAENLTASLREMAQVTVSRDTEVRGLVRRRAELAAGFEAATGIRLTYTDLLVETVARLLPEHPFLNAALTEEGIELFDTVNMGVAVALDDGLIVPVIRDAGTKSLGEIARERADLAARAQAGTLGIDDVEGGTFTVTNLGSFGADAFTPIVNPPQCAILGVGRLVGKPVVTRKGRVRARPTMWLSLTFDHRVVDGAPAARFLAALGERLA
ncbi:MAG TPA: dihydrolipoamide acetyltransferase family protein [Dermatophilaceae bacterium]|nr:dihydrolipoamide acetyltransferase family protein [Dermatophilaceae bacterium]